MGIIVPTTELEAVNYLLEAIEEEQVNTLVGTTDPDVAAAQRFLAQALRSLQTPGWEFNTEAEHTLSPDIHGTIAAPSNLVKFTVPGSSYAIRNSRLYDRQNGTYSFTEEVTGTAIFFLSFEELPMAARNYVTLLAAFSFQAKRAPDALVARLTQGEIDAAWADFVADDTRSGGFSFRHISDIQNRQR